jgi:hypothetical protein
MGHIIAQAVSYWPLSAESRNEFRKLHVRSVVDELSLEQLSLSIGFFEFPKLIIIP